MTIDGSRQGLRGGTTKSKHSVRIAQTSADAKLHASFEASSDGGQSFDYSESVQASKNSYDLLPSTSSSKDIIAYLKHMQRGGVTQPFGCTIAVAEGDSFIVIAYSENAPEMLGIMPQSVPSIGHSVGLTLGSDARDLFTRSSVSALEKAVSMADVSILNPITVHCRSSGKPFYAILHRIDVGLLLDFEPIKPSDVPITAAGALQSHRLVAKAITRLQSLPGGDVNLLCDTVVEEVRELTGYDRVMAYKFHRDEHGEVVAEMRRSDLEPYLGLHYPATDIPQAARFLFMKNRVRMISNCLAPPVKMIEDDSLAEPLSLSSSTLRAPHGCHAQYMQNMDSIASLVMAVVINDSEEESKGEASLGRRLWGLVVCHHTSPRSVPFPLRSACEFLMQVFSLQLNMELELAAQIREKHILKTQTVLCDMLLRESPSGIIVKSPNVMDLVKCDGAALIYKNQVWLLGITPTEAQVMDIVAWLLQHHADSSGISTDSLADAGYPGASSLGNMLCGFAAAKITATDFLFWFRSHTAKEVKWGGAKHDPEDRDDGRRMHPRSSFKAFLEVVKRRSLPWEDVEMDAIHSLQLILRTSFQEMEISDAKELSKTRSNDSKLRNLDELSTVAHEMVRLIETATAPIWAVDGHGFVNGWNLKVAELTGLPVEEAIGKSLVTELAEEDSVPTVERVLLRALQGEEEHNVEVHLKTFGDCKEKGAVIILVNACSSRDVEGKVVGVCFVGQDVTTQKMVMDKFTRIQGDYKTIVQSLNPLIPPIFGSDEFGFCSEWNPAMEKLSGWGKEEVLGKMLVGEVFGSLMASCRLKSQDALTKFILVLNKAMNGVDSEKFYLSFYDRQGKYVESLLIASKRTDTDGRITGVFCFLHIASPELLQGLLMKKAKEKMDKELEYIHQELKKPLEGISFIRHLLEVTNLSDDQKHLVQTSSVCERQLRNILEDDVKNIEEGYVELDTSAFNMGTVMDAVISQCMSVSSAKGVQIIQEVPEDLKALQLFGDQARLQQALAGYISGALEHTPASEEGIGVKAMYKQRWLDEKVIMIDFEFRISHPGDGLPDSLVNEIFESGQQWTPGGLSFALSRTLLKLMNGDVQYTRGTGRNLFLISIEFPLVQIDNDTSL